MEKYHSQDSLASLFTEDSAYFSDTCQCKGNNEILELRERVGTLEKEIDQIKQINNKLLKAFGQETLENDVTPILNLNETQTVDISPTLNLRDEKLVDVLTNEDQNNEIQEAKLTTPSNNVLQTSAVTYTYTKNVDNNVGILRAEMVRNTDGNGRKHTYRHIKSIEKFTINDNDRIQIFIQQSDTMLVTMLGGVDYIRTLTWDTLTDKVLNLSTVKDDIDNLHEIYNFKWLGLEDPLIFEGMLKQQIEVTPPLILNYKQVLIHNITQAMKDSVRDIWMDLLDKDPGETLLKIASLFQEKGWSYFFDTPPIQKPIHKPFSFPQIVYNMVPYVLFPYSN